MTATVDAIEENNWGNCWSQLFHNTLFWQEARSFNTNFTRWYINILSFGIYQREQKMVNLNLTQKYYVRTLRNANTKACFNPFLAQRYYEIIDQSYHNGADTMANGNSLSRILVLIWLFASFSYSVLYFYKNILNLANTVVSTFPPTKYMEVSGFEITP